MRFFSGVLNFPVIFLSVFCSIFLKTKFSLKFLTSSLCCLPKTRRSSFLFFSFLRILFSLLLSYEDSVGEKEKKFGGVICNFHLLIFDFEHCIMLTYYLIFLKLLFSTSFLCTMLTSIFFFFFFCLKKKK